MKNSLDWYRCALLRGFRLRRTGRRNNASAGREPYSAFPPARAIENLILPPFCIARMRRTAQNALRLRSDIAESLVPGTKT